MSRSASLPTPLHPPETLVEKRLPSGRSVTLRIEGAEEAIEVRSAQGEVDVRIVLTDAGPVVSLRGARLELESPDVAVKCNRFEVQAEEDLRLRSARDVHIDADELHAKTERDIHLNGAYIRLNCSPGLEVPVKLPDFAALAAAPDHKDPSSST